MAASPGAWPASAAAACAASTGPSPTLSSAMRAPVQRPSASTCTDAATPASAKSPWRREISSKAKPVPGAAVGISISTSISSGSSAVPKRPVKKSSAATLRTPPGPRRWRRAPSASITAGSSAAGSAWAMLPPMVPRLRICACATDGSVSAMRGARSASSALLSAARCRTIAPIRTPPSASAMASRPGMRLRSMSTAGAASRKFIAGTRLCPPARSLAS
jgi:hypothetical protein